MQATPITVYAGLAYTDEEYIDIQTDGESLDLNSYDLQMQILDADDDYSRIAMPTVSKDSQTTGRCWPTITAAQSSALEGVNAVWVLLLRPSDLTTGPRLIAYGPVRVEQGATWQS